MAEREKAIKKVIGHYSRRKLPLKVNQVKGCIETIFDGESPEMVSEVLEDLSRHNYIGVKPRVWTSSKKDTSRDTLLETWEEDGFHLKILSFPYKNLNPEIPSTRVCSFNVHFWCNPQGEFAFDKMLKTITDIDPDVVCLQEALFPLDLKKGAVTSSKDGWSRDDLIDLFFDAGYEYMTGCLTDNATHAEKGTGFGNYILSKYPFVKKNGFTLNAYRSGKFSENRCFTLVTIKPRLRREISIVNVHLDVWDETEIIRVREVKNMLSSIRELKDVVVCGDFNSLQRSDYTQKEWEWIERNNKGISPHTLVTDLMTKEGYLDSFPRGTLKYTVWTGRRVDYLWYKGDIEILSTGVCYTAESDHFPIFADYVLPFTDVPPESPKPTEQPKPTEPSIPGSLVNQFDCLLWTHNTPYETLSKIVSGDFLPEIRCCHPDGYPYKAGAQFRYGIDSQYGDIIFVMSPGDWWKKMKGVDMGTGQITPSPVLGHIFDQSEPFNQYSESKEKYDSYLLEEAQAFDIRPRNISGNGLECTRPGWKFSWCNVQVHIGESVGFENVEAVLVPRWLFETKDSNLLLAINNNLPEFPNGRVNLLNGKFIPYGPLSMSEHYQFFRQAMFTDDRQWLQKWYPGLNYYKFNSHSSTSRNPNPAGSSSRLAISPDAYEDAEKKYVALLTKGGCKKKQ